MTAKQQQTTTTMNMQKQSELPIPYYLRPNQHQRDMNKHMALLIPEMESTLCQTPMLRNRWYEPEEEYEPDVPCFIPTYRGKNGKEEQEPPKKIDYIWIAQQGKENQAKNEAL